MENQGVCCHVRECVHNCGECGCELDTIEITSRSADALHSEVAMQAQGSLAAVPVPHFCKNYRAR